MLNKDKFVELLSGLGELYDKKVTEFIFDVYYEALKDYTYEQISGSVKKCIATHKYNTIPKPAEILEWLEGSQDDKARIAWVMAHKALKEHGYYATVKFADPVISQVIQELGGWMAFCDTLHKDIPFVEKRFIDFYRTLSKRENKTSIKMMGFIEAKNSETGHHDKIPEVVMIGFEKEKLLLT